MNIMLNRLDNFKLLDKIYEFIPNDVKREMKIDARILGTGSKFLISNKDIMVLVEKSGLKQQIGINEYNALIRKPMFIFLLASSEEDFGKTKEQLDYKYGITSIILNNFAQAFSLGCWFIKDSCVASTNAYWNNMFNHYTSQSKRDMSVTLSTGKVSEISLDDIEMNEAIERMYDVLRYLSPDESNMGQIDYTTINGTVNWEIDKAISTEGKSFAKALTILQEARRTGFVSSKIDKYCSVLECLYSIKEHHKKNIMNITAAYIGNDDSEKDQIRNVMRDAYSVRSDSSHGDSLRFLKINDEQNLIELSCKLDEYVRQVFRKILKDPTLNYDNSSKEKSMVRAYFIDKAKLAYPSDYEKAK